MNRGNSGNGKKTGVGNHIHGEGQSDVVVALQAVAVVPEVVFRVLVAEVEFGWLTPLDDVVPQHHLIQDIGFGLVVRGQIEEELFGVPVERPAQVGIQVERYEAEVIALAASRVVGHVLHQLLGGGQLHVDQLVVLLECGGQRAHQRQSGQHRQREREDGVRPRQQCVHRDTKQALQTGFSGSRCLTRECTDVCLEILVHINYVKGNQLLLDLECILDTGLSRNFCGTNMRQSSLGSDQEPGALISEPIFRTGYLTQSGL